jgi:hypothetical protein
MTTAIRVNAIVIYFSFLALKHKVKVTYLKMPKDNPATLLL